MANPERPWTMYQRWAADDAYYDAHPKPVEQSAEAVRDPEATTSDEDEADEPDEH